MSETVEAFVPGHVTGFFTIDRDEGDPTRTGSRGAGLTLSEGVTVRASPADERAIELNGERVEMAAAERVLRTLDVEAVVHAETDLPLGAGFGVSGGVTLGTALVVNETFDRKLSENELATIAHGAEVQAGTGLGDVVAQLRGGVPIRLEPGGPQHGVLDGIARQTRVEFVSFGELSTAEVIAPTDGEGGANDEPADDESDGTDEAEGDTPVPTNGVGPDDGDGDGDDGDDTRSQHQAHITQKGHEALSRVVKEPTLASFVYASRRSMAMIGDTVFALGTGLSHAGYDPTVTTTSAAGATLL